MSRDDRMVARACRHLEAGETLLASVVGRELEGRRGRVALVTDRRIVVAWTRPTPPDVLPLIDCTAEFREDGRILVLVDGDATIALRDVEPVSAEVVVDCIARLDIAPVRERIGKPWKVRVVTLDEAS